MSFFRHPSPPGQEPPQGHPDPKSSQFIPSDRIIIEGTPFIKEIEDNPELQMGKFDIGNGMQRMWRPLNYNPQTGLIEEWK